MFLLHARVLERGPSLLITLEIDKEHTRSFGMRVLVGIGFVLAFNALQAITGVYLSSFLTRVDTAVVLLGTFSLTGGTFLVICCLTQNTRGNVLARNWRHVVAINVATCVSWAGFFLAVKYLEPALASAFINAVLPGSTLLLDCVIRRSRLPSRREMIAAFAMFFAMMAMGAVVFSGHSGRPDLPLRSYAVGFVMASACGLAMSATNVTSKKLNEGGMSAAQIMACRFWLLISVCAVTIDKHTFFEEISSNIWSVGFVALAGTLLPVFALQLGIQRLPPMTVAFLIGLAPIMFLCVQAFDSNLSFSWASTLCVIFTSLVVTAGFFSSLSSRLNLKIPVTD